MARVSGLWQDVESLLPLAIIVFLAGMFWHRENSGRDQAQGGFSYPISNYSSPGQPAFAFAWWA